MSINRQSEYHLRLNNVAGTALMCLREQFPNVYFYFFEKDYWLYFFDISRQYTPDIHVLDIQSNIVIDDRPKNKSASDFLGPEDPVIYVGRPAHLLRLCRLPVVGSRPNPIIFASIPIYSHSLKVEIWKIPINFRAFTSFCFPFLPFKHFLKISVGSFPQLFLHPPLFETKSLKAVLSSLAFIFGRFSRVYAAGSFSSDISKGFLDICQNPEVPPGRNNLILFDRTIDLQSLIKINDSYIGILEELGAWDPYENKISARALSKINGIPIHDAMKLPISTEDDHLFEKIQLLTLSDAMRTVSFTDFKNTTTENLIEDHTRVLNDLYRTLTNDYFYNLVMNIQKNPVDAKKNGRCVCLSPLGPSLAFRMLSSIHYSQNKDATNSIASLLSATFGITMFSKWNQIDEIAFKTEKIAPPRKIEGVTNSISSMEALLGQILTDEWKRSNFPIKDNFISTNNYLPNEKFRWFVGVIGGMTAKELRVFKKISQICRPNDEFIFMSTELYSPKKFMDNIIGNDI